MALKTKTCYAPVELYLHSPNTPSWRGAQLKHRDNFTFYLYLYTPCLSAVW